MKTTIEIELIPFSVPNYALLKQKPKDRHAGFVGPIEISLSDIDSYTLLKLCDNFKKEIFAKAGKSHPR